MQTASCCYWDKATDGEPARAVRPPLVPATCTEPTLSLLFAYPGYVSVKWESDHMQALCTVYGVVV